MAVCPSDVDRDEMAAAEAKTSASVAKTMMSVDDKDEDVAMVHAV